MTELELQRAIKKYLIACGHKCWQVDSGKKVTYKTRGQGLEKGFPDLFGVRISSNEKPQPFFIEVKLENGVLSDNQKKFLLSANENKILNGVAKSVHDAIEIIEGKRTIKTELGE